MPSPPLRRIRVEFLVPITVLSLRTGNSIVTFSCVLKMDLYYVQRTDPGTFVFSALYGVFVSVFLRKAHHQTPLGTKRSQSRPLAMQNTLLIWLQETCTS